MKNKVSVVLTTYNGEAYIYKQLESLYNQTVMIDELIIVDDCSKDSTVSIIQKFIVEKAVTYAKLYVNEENLGYKNNFYKGIQLTTGKYIFLCDQDDIWKPHKIEIFLKLFEDNNDILAINSGLSLIDKDDNEISTSDLKHLVSVGKPLEQLAENEIINVPLEMLMKRNVVPGCATAFTEKLKMIFLEAYNSIVPHDFCINLIAGMSGGCFFINTSTIYYRLHDSNTIGLSFNKKSKSSVTGTLDDRKTQLSFFHNIIHTLEKYSMLNTDNKDIKKLEDRYYVLSGESRLKKFFFTLTHYSLYVKFFSTRQFFGDLVYILNLDGIVRSIQKKIHKKSM